MRDTNLTYGQAIEAASQGHMIAREGWEGKGLFVYKQIPSEVSLMNIPNMVSVPHSVKEKLLKAETTLKYANQMILVQQDGRADSWVASSSDTFAQDWVIIHK